MKLIIWFFAVFVLSFHVHFAQSAQLSGWVEGTNPQNGANRRFKNMLAYMPWTRTMGDWCDAEGKYRGNNPFAVASYTAKQSSIDIDITQALKATTHGGELELVLKHLSGKSLRLYAKESGKPALSPRLVVEGSKDEFTIPVLNDTYIATSTYKSLGNKPFLDVSSKTTTFLRFALPPDVVIKRARLQMGINRFSGKKGGFYVFGSCTEPGEPTIQKGIASHFANDEGIDKHKSVLFTDNFNGLWWRGGDWTYLTPKSNTEVISDDRQLGFAPINGKALKIEVKQGRNNGLDMGYVFKKELGYEPEAVYFRYYLRFAKDWHTVDGGKLPGISGTYNRAGWGGRKANGKNGWSARGLYKNVIAGENPLKDKVPIGNYIYHVDQKERYGDNDVWANHALGYLDRNRWYSVEQYVRLNTPGKSDGVLKGWIDGKLAYENSAMQFRTSEKLKIEKIWMNVYHGGGKPTDRNIHLYIDNVVVATEYIGPMDRRQ